jgi:hypothetical protein
MKTRSEIEAEARQLTVLAREYEVEQGRLGLSTSSVSRILTLLPAPQQTFEVQSAQSFLRERAVVASVEKGELFFRLVERDIEAPLGRESSSEAPWANVMDSSSVLEILRFGYERREEERLVHALSAFAERAEESGETADSDDEAEIDSIVEANLLPPSDRMRIRADITDFVAHRISQREMIARTLRHHFYREESPERMAVRHELKLTIGEP